MHTSAIYEIEGILTLGEMETRGGAGDGNPEEVTKRPEVGHGELSAKRGYDFMQESIGRGGEDDVIYIQKEIRNVSGRVVDEKRCIGFGGNKSNRCDKSGKTGEPRTWGLF
jgi:hypothetical protein